MSPTVLRTHHKNPTLRPEADGDGRLFDPGMRGRLSSQGRGAPLVALEALMSVRILAKQLHDAFERWTEGHDLSETRFHVLVTIFHSPGRRLPLGELAEVLGVVPRTMTGVVDILERDGLVMRVPDAADRRSTLAELTPAGLTRIEAIRKSSVAQQAAATRGMTAEQLAELRHLCLLMIQNLGEGKEG